LPNGRRRKKREKTIHTSGGKEGGTPKPYGLCIRKREWHSVVPFNCTVWGKGGEVGRASSAYPFFLFPLFSPSSKKEEKGGKGGGRNFGFFASRERKKKKEEDREPDDFLLASIAKKGERGKRSPLREALEIMIISITRFDQFASLGGGKGGKREGGRKERECNGCINSYSGRSLCVLFYPRKKEKEKRKNQLTLIDAL